MPLRPPRDIPAQNHSIHTSSPCFLLPSFVVLIELWLSLSIWLFSKYCSYESQARTPPAMTMSETSSRTGLLPLMDLSVRRGSDNS